MIPAFYGNNVLHRSDHIACVITINKTIHRINKKKIVVPKDLDKLNILIDSFNFNIDKYDQANDILDTFYKSIYEAAYDNKCIKDANSTVKNKRNLNKHQKKNLDRLIRYQNEVKTSNKEE